MEDNQVVWMSHADRVQKLPEGFEVIGVSETPICRELQDWRKGGGLLLLAVFQGFHPKEVSNPTTKKGGGPKT